MALTLDPLRIGYVPEHFSTPLHFAVTYFDLHATLIPFPSGTGHMITALRSREIDVGIGLTEGWIAGLGSKKGANGSVQKEGGYSLVGTYVETPLCWAISTGANRDDIRNVESLKGRKMGVSRIGSGSYIMGFVLAEQHGWLSPNPTTPPFTAHPFQTFEALRSAVNDHSADFFMWEHFTSKRYFTSAPPVSADSDAGFASSSTVDTSSSASVTSSPSISRPPTLTSTQSSTSVNNPTRTLSPPLPTKLIRHIGEIYTPWPSWHIVARHPTDARLPGFFAALDRGIAHFEARPDEAVTYISSALDYTTADATEWLKTVRFAHGVQGVRASVVDGTLGHLRTAGVLVEGPGGEANGMIGFGREE